jgi:N-acetylglucosamine-6-phosphate deacetylase
VKTLHLIDLHTHGIGRYDTMTENPEGMARLYADAGITAFLPTIYSGTIGQMRANMEAVRRAMEAQKSEKQEIRGSEAKKIAALPRFSTSALILGVHLEGPFLNPLMAGAQDQNTFLKPTLPNLKRLIDGYEDIIKIITIAPEIPGALRVIERCALIGIRVNMGHSNATYRQALDGKRAGATGITHIFNAMRPIHHRETGIAGFGLIDEEIYIEVIPDGVHLDINTLRLILKIKPHNRIIFVSDSIKGAGIRRQALRKKGRLKGSLLTLSKSLENLKNLDVPIRGLSKFVQHNPLRYLSL